MSRQGQRSGQRSGGPRAGTRARQKASQQWSSTSSSSARPKCLWPVASPKRCALEHLQKPLNEHPDGPLSGHLAHNGLVSTNRIKQIPGSAGSCWSLQVFGIDPCSRCYYYLLGTAYSDPLGYQRLGRRETALSSVPQDQTCPTAPLLHCRRADVPAPEPRQRPATNGAQGAN